MKTAQRELADASTLLLHKEISFEKMLVFSGYPETNSVHTDRDYAVAKGLRNAIAQGLQLYAYMCEWLVDYFGAEWFRGGRLAISFLGLVFPGDRVTVKAEVTATDAVEDGTRVELAIWCENHRQEKVAAGTATATIR
jgi:acyl dehydratase